MGRKVKAEVAARVTSVISGMGPSLFPEIPFPGVSMKFRLTPEFGEFAHLHSFPHKEYGVVPL
jgi:hypothetical protein